MMVSQVIEVVFSTCFMVYWTFNFWLAPKRLVYIISLQSLLDLGTSLPTLVATFTGLCGDGNVSSFLAIARVLKFLRVFRLLRVVRSMELLTDNAKDAIHRQTMRLISTIVVIMVVSTGFVQFLANDMDQEWSGVPQRCLFESLEACHFVCPDPDECNVPTTNPEAMPPSDTKYHPCQLRQVYRGQDAICKNQMKFHDSLYFTVVTFGTVRMPRTKCTLLRERGGFKGSLSSILGSFSSSRIWCCCGEITLEWHRTRSRSIVISGCAHTTDSVAHMPF